MEKRTQLKKDIGLFVATALVAGNIMGSGIFMLPATLAQKSGPGASMIAWVLTGLGSIFLALSFARLGSKLPKTGGPYEYAKQAFGDFVGFMSAWLYWNGSWIGNVAVILAVASYVGSLFPVISDNHLAGFLFSSAILWIFTLINVVGVRVAGRMQTAITLFEVFLLLFFIVAAAIHFNVANITPLFPAGKGTETISAAAATTLWAFLGIESASITAGEIKNPEKNVKRSTILGILISTALYFAINISAMGAMPQEKLAESKAPLADILAVFFGSHMATVITYGAIIGILGTTIGWLLSTARMAFAAGEDEVFPKIFARVHPRFKTPYMSLIIGSVLMNILLIMNYTKSLNSAFNFVSLLATLSFLPVYSLTAASDILLHVQGGQKISLWGFLKRSFVPLLGFIYTAWAIYGSGAETVMYGCLLIMAGVPFYLYMNYKKKAHASTSEDMKRIA
jgi:APA family basic amino acid/polyamine antiporter